MGRTKVRADGLCARCGERPRHEAFHSAYCYECTLELKRERWQKLSAERRAARDKKLKEAKAKQLREMCERVAHQVRQVCIPGKDPEREMRATIEKHGYIPDLIIGMARMLQMIEVKEVGRYSDGAIHRVLCYRHVTVNC